MEYRTAHGIANVALWKNRPLLQRILASKLGLDAQRFFLRMILQELQAACVQFNNANGSSPFSHVAIFIPLILATRRLESAINQPNIDETLVRSAARWLDELAFTLETVPANY